MQDLTQSLSSEKRNLIIIFVGVEFVSDLVLRVVKVPALLLLCLVCLVLTHTHKRSLKKRQKLSLPRIQLTTWCLSSFPSPVTLLFLDFLYCFSWSLMFLQMLASSSRGFFLSILSVSLLKEFSESWSIHLRCLPHLQFTFNFSLLPEPFLCLCVPLILKYLSYSCCFTFFFSFFSNLYMQCFVSVYFSSTIAKNRRQIKIRFYLSLFFRGKKRVACCPRVKSWYCLKSVVCQSFNSTWK